MLFQKRFSLIYYLIIILLISCQENTNEPVIQVNDLKFSKINVEINNVDVMAYYYSSRYDDRFGSSSSEDTSVSIWSFNQIYSKNDSILFIVKNNYLNFADTPFSNPIGSSHKSIYIKFNNKALLFDTLFSYYGGSSSSDPFNKFDRSYSASSNKFILINVPYSINSDNTINIFIKGTDCGKYLKSVYASGSSSQSHWGDYSYSNNSESRVLFIVGANDSSYIKIDFLK